MVGMRELCRTTETFGCDTGQHTLSRLDPRDLKRCNIKYFTIWEKTTARLVDTPSKNGIFPGQSVHVLEYKECL